jgi:hypothetical protein
MYLKIHAFFLHLLILTTMTAFAQPQVLFNKTYGTIETDNFEFAFTENNNGAIFVGTQMDNSNGEIWIVKVDSDGTVLSEDSFGDRYSRELLFAIKTESNGIVILASYRSESNRNYDTWIIKHGSWNKYFGADSLHDFLSAGTEVENSNMIFGGSSHKMTDTDSDVVWLLKVNSTGDIVWSKKYGTPSSLADVKKVFRIDNDNAIIVGNMENTGWVARIDASGDTLWSTKIPNFGIYDGAMSADNNIMAYNYNYKVGAFRVVKINPQNGDTLWLRSYANKPISGMIATKDGGVLLWANYYRGVYSAILYKLDIDGNLLWTKTVAEGSYLKHISDIAETDNNNFVLVGNYKDESTNRTSGWFVQLNSSGDTLCTQFYGCDDEYSIFYKILLYDNGEKLLAGNTFCFYNEREKEGWAIKLDQYIFTDITKNKHSIPDNFQLYQNYPNPFNPATIIRYSLPKADNVTLAVYDINGRLINTLVNEKQAAGIHQINWSGKDAENRVVAAGIYFYRIKSGSFMEIKKMILLK